MSSPHFLVMKKRYAKPHTSLHKLLCKMEESQKKKERRKTMIQIRPLCLLYPKSQRFQLLPQQQIRSPLQPRHRRLLLPLESTMLLTTALILLLLLTLHRVILTGRDYPLFHCLRKTPRIRRHTLQRRNDLWLLCIAWSRQVMRSNYYNEWPWISIRSKRQQQQHQHQHLEGKHHPPPLQAQ